MQKRRNTHKIYHGTLNEMNASSNKQKCFIILSNLNFGIDCTVPYSSTIDVCFIYSLKIRLRRVFRKSVGESILFIYQIRCKTQKYTKCSVVNYISLFI